MKPEETAVFMYDLSPGQAFQLLEDGTDYIKLESPPIPPSWFIAHYLKANGKSEKL